MVVARYSGDANHAPSITRFQFRVLGESTSRSGDASPSSLGNTPTIRPDSAPTGPADTGTDVGRGLLLASLLLSFGVGLVCLGRRRVR